MAWYETFFNEHYLKEYEKGLTPERAQKEVNFINSTLNLPQAAPGATGGARILDLCCGHGRHTVELAATGYSMVGQDLTGNNQELRAYIAPDGRVREVHLTCRLYFYPELTKMLNHADLTPIQVFGDYDGSEYTWDSRRLIVLAEKPCER